MPNRSYSLAKGASGAFIRRAIWLEANLNVKREMSESFGKPGYEFLYETGAAQSDATELTVENIDWQDGLLVYHRKKLGPDSEPARLLRASEFISSLTNLSKRQPPQRCERW